MMRTLRLFLIVVVLTSVTCLPGAGATAPTLPAGKTRILFIGNSLTYFNDLPGMVTALARLAGDTLVATSTVAFPDFALEDHWAEGTARRSLQQGKWEFVVMQQGPSSLPENQVNLATWSARFAPLIRSAGATPVLYMVWPTINRSGDFPGVRTSYRNAAAGVQGIFAPAGDAWVAAFEENAAADLYSSDGLHPTPSGTYVAALVILSRVRGIEPEQLPLTVPGAAAPAAFVGALQRAARVALDRNPARP